MRLLESLTGLLLVIAAVSVAGQAGFPKDVYPETGNRFPAVRTGLTPDAFGPGPISSSVLSTKDLNPDKRSFENWIIDFSLYRCRLPEPRWQQALGQ